MEIVKTRRRLWSLKFLRWPLGLACMFALVAAVAGLSEPSAELGTINITSGGMAWVTTMEGEELDQSDDKVTFVEQGDEPQGFASMDSMLQWAIGHSDPEKLKVAAQDAQRLTPDQLAKRRADIKELMDKLRMPSDAELMKIAIADLVNSTTSTEERQRALDELLILVEPIDNANDLHKLGGLLPVIGELERPEEELRITAAWVLGKACQNNLIVQKQILQHGGLPKLMELVRSSSSEEAAKALYAVSAIIRNFPLGQEAFYLEGGATLLEILLGGPSVDIRLRRKSLFLVADLAEQSHELRGGQLDAIVEISSDDASKAVDLFNKGLLRAVVNLIEAPDMDTQEKALMAVQSLSKVSRRVQRLLIDACQLEAALERMKFQLHELLEDPDQADFARDLEAVRQEVVGIILVANRQSNVEHLKDEL